MQNIQNTFILPNMPSVESRLGRPKEDFDYVTGRIGDPKKFTRLLGLKISELAPCMVWECNFYLNGGKLGVAREFKKR